MVSFQLVNGFAVQTHCAVHHPAWRDRSENENRKPARLEIEDLKDLFELQEV
jgi:hypothetical protein